MASATAAVVSTCSPSPLRELPWYRNYMLASNLSTPPLQSLVIGGTTVLCVKIPSPRGDISIYRRLDTDFVNATHMFRAAYPTAGEALEKREMMWLDSMTSTTVELEGNVGYMAGTWVSLAYAKRLAKDYGIERHTALLFSFSNPVERRKARKVTFAEIQKPEYPQPSASESRGDIDILSANLNELKVANLNELKVNFGELTTVEEVRQETVTSPTEETKGATEDDAMSVDYEPLDKKEDETNQSPPLKNTTEIPENNNVQNDEKSAESVNKENTDTTEMTEMTEEAPSKEISSDVRDKEHVSGLKRRCEELERDLTAERRKVRVLALTAVGFATTTVIPFLLG
ncbi:4506_t:CDS:2 [Paraglomus occultum]|uniref:4506_t:CDS:1 n=1 Tax=Paraglomus occultum TaxID=144539 RepID=A0A9N9ASU0_9GLOM|nr:4506_t:CDS:2 [Paraglomus occultum]